MKARTKKHWSPVFGIAGVRTVCVGAACGESKADKHRAFALTCLTGLIAKRGSKSFHIDSHGSACNTVLIEIPSAQG